MSRNPLIPLLITVALLLLAFFVMMHGIDAMQMNPDEELSYRNMAFDFPTSMIRLATRNNQAPLWWIQIWGWQRTAGMSEFAGRVNSLLWSMLTLSVLYQIARSAFGEKRFGWFAIAILSVNAYFFIYAHEIRMYAMAMTAAVLSMRFFLAWLEKRTWRLAIMYGLSAALLLYIHYYFVFVVSVQALYFAIFHLLNWQLLKQGFAAGLLALGVWLPWVVILYGQLRFIGFAEERGLVIPTLRTNLPNILDLAQLSSNGFLWLYALLLLIGLFFLWRNRGYQVALFWLIISPAIVLIINRWASIYNIRYTSFFIPAIGLAVGAALASISIKWLRWGLLAIVCLMSLFMLPNYYPDLLPYRELFQEISSKYREGDAIYINHTTPDDLYVADQMARYLPPELMAHQISSLEAAQGYRRVWYLTDSLFDEGVRATFRDLEVSHRVRDVVGDCTSDWCYVGQLMVAPPSQEPVLFGEIMGFLGADISPVIDNQLPVMLWWMVQETPQVDYSIALQLLNADGSLAAQVDRQIQPPDFTEIPTSQMQTGGNYIDLRLLDVSNLPAGDYRLQLVVYWWQDGSRLSLPDGSDAWFIQTITLGEQ